VLSSANCDVTYYGDSLGYYGNCFDEYVAQGKLIGRFPGCTQAVVDAVNADPTDKARAAPCWPPTDDPSWDETDRDKFSSELGLAYMKSHAGRLPVVMAARVGRMWDLYVPELGRDDEPLGQNVRFNWQVEGRGRLSSRAAVLMYWALLPLAAGGAVVLWRRRIPLSPLLSMTVVITVTAAITMGITRYRVPVDVVVVVLAAAAIEALVARLVPDRWGPSLTRRRDERDVKEPMDEIDEVAAP
jgi:hypothetical protein